MEDRISNHASTAKALAKKRNYSLPPSGGRDGGRGCVLNIIMEEKKNLALGKINFIMLAISMVIVVIGFVMMSGASSDTTQYNPEIFSAMRIKVAPVVCFVGFVSIIVGIMYRPKQK